MNTQKILTSLAAVSLLAFSASVGSATIFVYEGFDYDASAPLAGETAPTGLGAWSTISGGSTVTAPGLEYTNLVVGGHAASFTTGGALYANLTTPFDVPASSIGEIWGSFIMATANTAGDAALSIFQTANPTASTNALASIGLINSGDARLIAGRTMSGGGNNGLATSTVPVTQQNLYVFRITIDTNAGGLESGTFWINPTITEGMAVGDLGSGWTTGLTNTGLSGVAAIGIYTTGTNAATFDEIRLGSSLDSVLVAIPEPSAYAALFGLLALGLIIRRRQKRTVG